jgi:hypothetical protein
MPSAIDDLPPPPSSLAPADSGIDDLPPPPSPGIIQSAAKGAWEGVKSGLSKFDSYTGAPARAAVYAAETSPTEMGRPMAGMSAFANQFGQDPSNAPTGQDIVDAGGYFDKGSTASKVAGVATDMAVNPINFLPVGAAIGAAAKGVKGALGVGSDAAEGVSDALKSFAAKKAIASTGATGVQAAKFAPDAGQALLDQGIVSFGNSQATIAQKATDALDASGKKIGDILTNLDSKGATVDQADVIDAIRKRATDLGKRSSQYGVSDSLNALADRMQSGIEASGGNSEIPLTEAEQIKREFQAGANYNSTPNELSHAKEVAGIYRQAVEDAATKLDPKAGEAFAAEKKAYSLLSPVQEATAKRASTVAQSPHGGLMDTVATIAGEGVGGVPGMVIAPIARRAIATRIAPSLAASANFAGNALGKVPAFANGAVPEAALSAITSPMGRVVADIGAKGAVAAPALSQVASNGSPNSNVAQGAPASRAPSSGPDAWAQDGIKKLGIDDDDLTSTLMNDPKARQLLYAAHDLAPGSKAMKQIMTQIQNGWGK